MEPDSPPNLLLFHLHQNQESKHNDEDDDDEALSLCDLATSKHQDQEANRPEEQFSDELEEDFDFSGSGNTLPENKMCSADELFCSGQILPLQHSVSSRSSSTRSNNSGTSWSSNTSGSEFKGNKPTTRNHNQFHSHPSPNPKIRTRSINRHSNPKTSSKWSFLQLGVMKPQEIGLEDLKNRSLRSHGNSRSSNMEDQDQQKKKKEKEKKKKKMQMKISLLGGCKFSANAIENTVCSRIPMVKPTGLKEDETKSRTSKESNIGRRKDAVSSHRTSEWLKQLSIQDSAL